VSERALPAGGRARIGDFGCSRLTGANMMALGPRTFSEDYDRIKLLFDYTKWHIGIYTTLGTLMVTIIGWERLTLYVPLLWLSLSFIGLAGLSGGVIASTLPECDTLEEFFRSPTGFWGLHWLSGRTWTRIEHTAFWMGVLAGVAAFALPQTGFA
jgi:hypothetical protein